MAVAEVGTNDAQLCNFVAWYLATLPDSELREMRPSLGLAKKAAELEPENAAIRNTLGVALYRSGNWQEAIQELKRSEQLDSTENQSFNGFFLAMAHWQLGHRVEGLRYYQQALDWMRQNQPEDEELIRFRDEAARLLDVTD